MPDPDRYDVDKICEVVLALLSFTLHDDDRAWKGLDWEIMDQLHERGWIDAPRNLRKSVVLTEEGLRLAEEFAQKHFRRAD